MKKLIVLIFCSFVSLFANSLDEIKQKGVLRVGVYEGQPPFSKIDNGVFVGFEIELAKSIANMLFGKNSGKLEFVTIVPQDRIPVLQENKVDLVIANYTNTKERAKYVDFSMPYFSVNIGVLTNSDDNIKNMQDLKGKTILCGKSSTADIFFKNKGYNIAYCDTASQCYSKLKSKEADAYAADNIVVMTFPILDNSVEVSMKNLGEAEFLAIGVQKGNKDLLSFVNQSLIQLSKDNFFQKEFIDSIDPFYKGTADKKYFLLDDIYSIFG